MAVCCLCSALIEVLLLFSEWHQLHHPPLPSIFYSQCFPFRLASRVTANIVFSVIALLFFIGPDFDISFPKQSATDYVTADHDIQSLTTFSICLRSRIDGAPGWYMVALDYSVPGKPRQLAILYGPDVVIVVVFDVWVG